jgi:hypothetical protein
VLLNIFELSIARVILEGDYSCEPEMTCSKTVRVLIEVWVIIYTLASKYDLNHERPFCFFAMGDRDFSTSLSQCFRYKTLLRS